MNKKNIIRLTIVCICGVVIFIAAAIIISSQKSFQTNDTSSAGVSSYITDQGDIIAPEGYSLLPPDSVGNWQINQDAHVLQSPRNAQISEEDALASETNSLLVLTYANYRTSRTSEIWSPLYKVQENCDISVFDTEGIDSSGIKAEFGDSVLSVTKIEVYNSDGVTIADTVFIINDSVLVYYGTGNYVFAAYKVEAVG